jgi:hypothetical protein
VIRALLALLAAVFIAYLTLHNFHILSPAPNRDYQASKGDAWTLYLASDSQCPGAGDHQAPAPAQQRAMACLIDNARARYRHVHPGWAGRTTLPLNSELERAAELKANLLVRCQQFSHTPCHTSFASVFRQAGFGRGAASTSVGENLAYGQDEQGSPRATLDNWLNSPEHRQNLFTAKWHVQGLALRQLDSFLGYKGVSVWVSEFGVVG